MDLLIRKNHSGIGLAQVMVMMGVVASLSIAILNMGKSSTKSNKSIEIRDKVRNELALIGDVLHSPSACQGFLQNQPINSLTALYTYDGQNPFSVPINDEDANGNPVTVYNFRLGGEYFSYYILYSISLEPDETNASLFYLALEYHIINQYEGSVNMPSKFVSRIRGKVELTGNSVDNCFTYSNQGLSSQGVQGSYMTPEEALSTICAGPGAIEQNGTCVTFMLSAMGCPHDKPFLKGYSIGGQTGDVELYEPVCSSMPYSIQHWWTNRNTYRCASNQIQTGINYLGRAICEDVPECEELESLRLNSNGQLECEAITIDPIKTTVNDGMSCGIKSENNVISFSCGCSTAPSCEDNIPLACFGQPANNDGCGGLCGLGSMDCCDSDPNNAGRGSLDGISCVTDADCWQSGACVNVPGFCQGPGPAWSPNCENNDQSNCNLPECSWGSGMCMPNYTTPCADLPTEGSCTYDHASGFIPPNECAWIIPNQKECSC
ncbi:hypothetical protein N9N67_05185 [Bacteriovoracaceae bacterium]|nr:hypothetical protein [Bacteriovoracaceae bacterium]